jgi:polyisoprenoid-binding protein YceI
MARYSETETTMSLPRGRVALEVLVPSLAIVLATRTAHGQSLSELVRSCYDADPQHSEVGFAIRIFGAAKVRGRFRDYAATIVYDQKHPEHSSVTAVIQTKSIDTGMDFRDKHLRSPDFFDTAIYPTIVFQSDRIEQAANGYRAIGRFTMHGVTRTIAIPIVVTLQPENRGASGTVSMAFEGAIRLSRKDFGIAGTNKYNPDFDPAVSMLSDSVDVNIELLAMRPGYLTFDFRGHTPPSIADTVGRTIAASGADSAVRLYRSLRGAKTGAFNFSAFQLDALGHQLLQRGQVQDAITILTLNEEMYPAVDGVAGSLAEAYAWAGDSSRAVAEYRRAMQVDSLDTSSIEMLRHLVLAGGTGAVRPSSHGIRQPAR